MEIKNIEIKNKAQVIFLIKELKIKQMERRNEKKIESVNIC